MTSSSIGLWFVRQLHLVIFGLIAASCSSVQYFAHQASLRFHLTTDTHAGAHINSILITFSHQYAIYITILTAKFHNIGSTLPVVEK